ncbi:allantoicase [Pseudenhygromyxa sp. WMMC2535]|uniref:allantoicase n=1 Tax=Pseudenhygromyxa sp. WMMC2535 TaxID=2712867 RepID=UPI001551896D|nr:allantoicase [Pseudenhygromyxa sp. WMMC2535]NVB40071.1 allantoicase [Pseudenhygromyxa sp. WMMC2535]
MIVTASDAPSFPGLVDLASASLGGRALGCSDEFFAAAANLCKVEAAIFDPERYTERGKWMDGWESRRRRSPGEDWCVLALGVRGRVRAVDLDTSHFLGNHAPFARLEGVDMGAGEATLEALADASWRPLLEQSPLRAGSHNCFTLAGEEAITHLRLTITPDGGVARLRAFGEVAAAPSSWPAPDDVAQVQAQLDPAARDLAALRNGGRALACSDMFFAPMDNLIAPGRSTFMGGGWETRRRRGPGHDWILLRLAAPGRLDVIEVDTGHFHGNHAQRCALWGCFAPTARTTDLLVGNVSEGGWQEVLPQPAEAPRWRRIFGEHTLGPDRREFIAALEDRGPFTHLRLETFPDGGVARLRAYGRAVEEGG